MTDTALKPFKSDIRLHGKLPRVDHVRISYPVLVHYGLLSRARNFPFFNGFISTGNKAVPIQSESIPFLGVYLLQEFMAPDGDANAGEPRFRTSARYGFSVIVQNNDPDAAEYTLDKAMDALTMGLFSDPTLYNNHQFKIQSYIAGRRQHVYGHVGQDNQTPIAELRWELTCDLGVIDYPPFVEDDLEVIHLETVYPDQARKDTTRQIKNEYDMEQ